MDVGDYARCPVGEARITLAYNIHNVKHIIHTVAPLLDNDGKSRPAVLKRCYFSCLELASLNSLKSVAFCSLGTGFYGYP